MANVIKGEEFLRLQNGQLLRNSGTLHGLQQFYY